MLNRIFQRKETKFIVVGGLNTAIGLIVYPILYFALIPLGFGYIGILAISQVICTTFSFSMHKTYVFRAKGNIFFEYIRFIWFHAFYLGINFIALPVVVEWAGINPVIGQTVFTVVVAISSYFWHNKITFSKK